MNSFLDVMEYGTIDSLVAGGGERGAGFKLLLSALRLR